MGIRNLGLYPPVRDEGWRVGLYPPGTTFLSAVAQATAAQAGQGRTVDPTTCRLLPNYFIRGTSDTLPDGAYDNRADHGWRNTPVVLGTVALQYRAT